MKKIVLIDPSVSSLNIGDEVIGDGVKRQISFILNNSFVVDLSSHLPLSYIYKKAMGKFDFTFVCGSNLLMGKMNGLFRQWHIGYKDINFLKDSILVGVGWWQYDDLPNLYTKKLYNSILSRKFIHSVRDSYTESMLKNMGIDNVLNTGCATMWDLTPDHCKKIPTKKSNSVIFTLTDYNQDREVDKKLINMLSDNYNNVYFWPQGIGDLQYLNSLNCKQEIKIIGPSLKAYDMFLESNDVDFVGTRLHGGIRALQKNKRTIILAVDNRAKEKQKDFNIVCVERNEIQKLDSCINCEWETEIKIPLENINKWKSQFYDAINCQDMA